MKLLFDFFPILLFFIVYKFYGIYFATAAAMAASAAQVGGYWIKHKRFEILHIVTLICVILLGGATLIFHNSLFIKWKPTVIYWIFALLFLGSQWIGSKPLIQRMMESNISLNQGVWKKLNLSWIMFFILMGIINLWVAYHYNTNVWVNFKLFGTLGITLVFVIFQAIYMAKHSEQKPWEEKKDES